MTVNYEKFINLDNSLIDEAIYIKNKHFLGRLKLKIASYYQNASTRQQLKKLSAEQLKDIGITIEQARHESKKYFWQQ